jgi:hypothetical protein
MKFSTSLGVCLGRTKRQTYWHPPSRSQSGRSGLLVNSDVAPRARQWPFRRRAVALPSSGDRVDASQSSGTGAWCVAAACVLACPRTPGWQCRGSHPRERTSNQTLVRRKPRQRILPRWELRPTLDKEKAARRAIRGDAPMLDRARARSSQQGAPRTSQQSTDARTQLEPEMTNMNCCHPSSALGGVSRPKPRAKFLTPKGRASLGGAVGLWGLSVFSRQPALAL